MKLHYVDKPILRSSACIKSKKDIPYFLIVVPEGFSACRINKTGKEILQMCNGVNTIKKIAYILSKRYHVNSEICFSDVRNFLEEAYENGFLYTPDIPPKQSFEYTDITRPSEVWFHITNSCNLQCLTCFKNAGRPYKKEMSLFQMKQVIDEIKRLAPNTLVVSGGEPLIREDCLPILKYIKEKGLFIHFITNGTLITNKIALSLREIGVDFIQVSLDGSSPAINDRIRGKGAFYKTMEGATNLNFDTNLMEKRFDFNFKMTRVPPNLIKKSNCGLGSAVISIAADGSVYPCQWLHIARYKAGDATLLSLREIYYNSVVFRKLRNLKVDTMLRDCAGCEIRYFCGGGCRAHAFKETGNILGKDPLCCVFKPTFDWGLWGAPEPYPKIEFHRKEVFH